MVDNAAWQHVFVAVTSKFLICVQVVVVTPERNYTVAQQKRLLLDIGDFGAVSTWIHASCNEDFATHERLRLLQAVLLRLSSTVSGAALLIACRL